MNTGDKRYSIIIKEFVIEETPTKQEWVKGGLIEPSESGYGYTPQITTKEKVERTIYIQNIDKLYLPNVIKAINDL